MTWVIKAANDNYLHDWHTGLYGKMENVQWHGKQEFAWRFDCRNLASCVAAKLHMANARIVRLATEKRSTSK